MMLLILSIAFVASITASPTDSPTPVSELLSTNGFSEFKEALVKHNMTDLLNSTEPLTIFAPSNDAFKYLKENPWMKNMTNDMMKKMLNRLIVLRRKIMPKDMQNEMMINVLSREKLRINLYPRLRTINGVMIVMEPNVQTPLVIIYRVNRFPMVPMEGRNLMELLGRRKERFSTLTRAIEVAGLKETLKQGNYTLFAPTNDAFKALPEGTVAKLLETPAELKTILMGHIINGTYFLAGLIHSPELPFLNGKTLKFVANGTRLTVGEARLFIRESMIAENGALHVIDRVLLP